MEISYQLGRLQETAAIKTWIDKNDRFNGKFMELPALANSRKLLEEVMKLTNDLAFFKVVRDEVETILDKVIFDATQDERFPFTRELFDDLNEILSVTGIRIAELEHLQYRDRYTFCRGNEMAVYDVEYNLQGFFGRVIPLTAKCNSVNLLTDLEAVFRRLPFQDL